MAIQALLIEGFHGQLKYTENDICRVRETFNRLNISTQTAPLGNARDVREVIEEKCSRAYSNDTLIIYYSGHGELRGGKLNLRIADTRNVYNDLLNINQIIDTTLLSAYMKIALILDCCHAEAAQKAIEDLERFHLLYSSRTLQKSWELDEYQMSAFTMFMCDALQDLLNSNANESITLHNLSAEIRSRRDKYNQAHNTDIPRPGAIGSKADEIVLYISYQSGETKFAAKIEEYRQNFLHCIENCSKACSGKFFWCDALFRHDIEMTKYTVPTVNTNEGTKLKLSDFFIQWINSNDAYLALLANAGVGKTSACFYLVSMATRGELNVLVPVLIPLQMWEELAKKKDVIESISEFSNKIFTSEEIRELIKSKQLVLLLDGFDEISSESALSSIIANFKKLAPFLRLGCKTILTCRTHYFAEESQINDVLQGQVTGTDFAVLLLGDEYNFLIGELQEFSESEILEVIQLSDATWDANKIWADIKAIYDLRDLAKRAIILKMILKTLPELQMKSKNHKITASTLYRIYTYKLLKRELGERRYKMDINDLEKFIEYIASLMWTYQTLSINTHTFQKEIADFYSQQLDVQFELDQYIYSGRISSFFVRDRHDNYAFCHKSFFEYYIARHCIRSIENGESDFSGWDRKWFDKEIASFVTDIIIAEPRKYAIIQLFRAANQATHPTVIWNVLHILSLLNLDSVQEYLTDDTKEKLIKKAGNETNCVIIRQYCRIISKFIDRCLSEQLIEKIIDIVKNDPEQNRENNETYFNYYNGKEAACNAFVKHLQSPSPKYDAKLHLYLLGDIAGPEYLEPLRRATNNWPLSEYEKMRRSIEDAIKSISIRDQISAVTVD